MHTSSINRGDAITQLTVIQNTPNTPTEPHAFLLWNNGRIVTQEVKETASRLSKSEKKEFVTQFNKSLRDRWKNDNQSPFCVNADELTVNAALITLRTQSENLRLANQPLLLTDAINRLNRAKFNSAGLELINLINRNRSLPDIRTLDFLNQQIATIENEQFRQFFLDILSLKQFFEQRSPTEFVKQFFALDCKLRTMIKPRLGHDTMAAILEFSVNADLGDENRQAVNIHPLRDRLKTLTLELNLKNSQITALIQLIIKPEKLTKEQIDKMESCAICCDTRTDPHYLIHQNTSHEPHAPVVNTADIAQTNGSPLRENHIYCKPCIDSWASRQKYEHEAKLIYLRIIQNNKARMLPREHNILAHAPVDARLGYIVSHIRPQPDDFKKELQKRFPARADEFDETYSMLEPWALEQINTGETVEGLLEKQNSFKAMRCPLDREIILQYVHPLTNDIRPLTVPTIFADQQHYWLGDYPMWLADYPLAANAFGFMVSRRLSPY